MRQAGIKDPLVIDQNFRAFDKDGSGFVDFVEYVTALSVFQKGNPEERLRLLFDLYDTDKSGKLSYNEIFQMYKAGLTAKGGYGVSAFRFFLFFLKKIDREFSQYENRVIHEMATTCMETADVNKDGEIDFDEFKTAVMKNQVDHYRVCVDVCLICFRSYSSTPLSS